MACPAIPWIILLVFTLTVHKSWDKIAYNAPYYLIVESAGNSRAETGPAVGKIIMAIKAAPIKLLLIKAPGRQV